MEPDDRRLGAALRFALLVFFLWTVKSVAVPIVLGALFASILVPLRRHAARRLGRLSGLAPALVTASTLVLVVIPFALVATQAALSANALLSGGAEEAVDGIQHFASTHLEGAARLLHLRVDALRPHLAAVLQRAGLFLASLLGVFVQAVPGVVVRVFLFVVSLYYFLRDGGTFVRFLLSVAPYGADETAELRASLEQVVRGVIVGGLVTAAVQGGLTVAALFLFGVPGALLLGIVAALFSVVPMVGTVPVTVGAVVYLLAIGRYGAAAGMAVAAVVIGLSDNVVRPWAQTSRASRLHPLLAVASIFGGVAAFGPAGVFLGPAVGALAVWALMPRRASPGPPAPPETPAGPSAPARPRGRQ